MRIKPGFGYWEMYPFPVFRRAGDAGVELVGDLQTVPLGSRPSVHGCDSIGTTASGKRVAFHAAHTDTGHATE